MPKSCDWASLRKKTGEPLEAHYLTILQRLGHEPGMLGAIFFKAQNKIQDPAKLSRLVQMIDAESWVGMDADTKGDLYEGLLQKNAEDTKSGAGQYFTPRAVIQAMVECVRPEPLKTVADPACGTGGFFLGVHQWLTRPGQTLNKKQAAFLKDKTFYGNEIVASTRRLCGLASLCELTALTAPIRLSSSRPPETRWAPVRRARTSPAPCPGSTTRGWSGARL